MELLEYYKLALDKHAILAITNPKGQITYVNDAFCHVSRYQRNELIGKDHRLVNSGFHPSKFFTQMWQTISTGKTWQGDVCNRTKYGDIYWVQTTIVPFSSDKGEIKQYLAVRTDITDKIKAQEELRTTTEKLRLEQDALQHKNIALHELLSHIEQDKEQIRQQFLAKMERIIFPLLKTMEVSAHSIDQKSLQLLEKSLLDIALPYSKKQDSLRVLTPKELQVCNMIKNGLGVKEIAQMLHLSPRTVDKHRENIRGKLGLKKKKINLTTYLLRE